ncbi:hypothetical protein [Pontibacter burrus]|uniref:STAS/SEC14 domain-containing protein n=1 Tax=Pontibacter burrus TaxID=2704466 RepID=A0A6B3LV80_9BACT|nr:hypothetical protein [Pontibacter burrus]NEM99683.1 hypothetical protein [Pontibacter burrus]
MILLENSIMKLEYNPATDILDVKYPDLFGYLLPEIRHSIDTLLETVISYDVKKVLLDSRETIVSIKPEESTDVSVYMASGLANTRLQKLARLQSADTEVEGRAEENFHLIKKSLKLTYELKIFSDKDKAMAWLTL